MIRSVDLVAMVRQNLITSSRLYRTCNESASTLKDCFALGDWPLRPSLVDVPCPFGGDICSINNAVSLDTGYLNTQKDLGINAPDADSIDFRKTTTCAPLKSHGYSSNVVVGNNQNDLPPAYQNYTGYFYGKNLRLGTWISSS